MSAKRTIPFSPPDITELEINEVIAALQSGWITTGGRTKLLEQKLSEYMGTRRTAALSAQTTAAELTLRILGVGPEDEVIVPAYTYTASASVIHHVGAKLVMVDVGRDSFELDYDAVRQAITERTKVIIPVDLGGRMCDYERLQDIVEQARPLFHASNKLQSQYGRIVIMADSAHGFGAVRKGRYSGQWADFTTFSFHAVKNLTTGEGGAVTWKSLDGLSDDWLYQQYMLMSLHGQSKDAFHKNQLGNWEYDIVYPAYKCNMTDIQAAIGLKQLERYDSILRRRKEIILKYDEVLLPYGVKTLVHYDEEGQSSGHLYLMRIPGITEQQRNQMIVDLAERGVATNVHYKPLPMMTAYQQLGFSIEDYPNAYHQYCNEITLPLHTCLSDEDVEYVIQQVREVFSKWGMKNG